MHAVVFLFLLSAKASTARQVATLAGVKGTIAYTTKTTPLTELPDAFELSVDLATVLDPPDPDLGNRRPLPLVNVTVTALLPGEARPRARQRLYAMEDAGQYAAHLRFVGSGSGSLRVEGVTQGGEAFAIMLPCAFGAAKGKAGDANVKILPHSTAVPEEGDSAIGKVVYATHCACCHGANVTGDGDAPHFDAPEFSWFKTDDDYRHAVSIDRLRDEDVVAYVGPFRPSLAKMAPEAASYVAREITCDAAQLKKIHHTSQRADRVALFALYKDETVKGAPTDAPQLVANDARALDAATSDQRIGYVSVVRGDDSTPELWLRLDNDWRLKKVLPRNGHAQAAAHAPSLADFVGLGGRQDSAVARMQSNDIWGAQTLYAYLLTVCAARVYESEEEERSWAK